MKKILTVKLEVTNNDEATGEWGLRHAGNDEFNTFWSAIGICHDVFEHSHEGLYPYFSGKYENNVAGEIVAMGALTYYLDNFYQYAFRRRPEPGYYSVEQSIVATTQDFMEEGFEYGGTNYFYEGLVHNVPYQKPIDSYLLTSVINEHSYKIEECREKYPKAHELLKTVRESDLKRLYRFGYNYYSKIVPWSEQNEETLCKFYDFWETIINCYTAEEFGNSCSYVIVDIFHNSNKDIVWEINFRNDYTGWSKISSLDFIHPKIIVLEELFNVSFEEEY